MCVQMHIQIEFNIQIFQLEKKLDNKYEHLHEPMVFLVVNFWYFVKILLREMLSVNVFLLMQYFSCTKWKRIKIYIGVNTSKIK
jgi:hypothetical protein